MLNRTSTPQCLQENTSLDFIAKSGPYKQHQRMHDQLPNLNMRECTDHCKEQSHKTHGELALIDYRRSMHDNISRQMTPERCSVTHVPLRESVHTGVSPHQDNITDTKRPVTVQYAQSRQHGKRRTKRVLVLKRRLRHLACLPFSRSLNNPATFIVQQFHQQIISPIQIMLNIHTNLSKSNKKCKTTKFLATQPSHTIQIPTTAPQPQFPTTNTTHPTPLPTTPGQNRSYFPKPPQLHPTEFPHRMDVSRPHQIVWRPPEQERPRRPQKNAQRRKPYPTGSPGQLRPKHGNSMFTKPE